MSPRLKVERQEHSHDSTISTVYFDGDFVCYMLERAWAGNAPFVSCIDVGVYQLVQHKYKGRVDTFALVGNGVTHYEEPGSVRYLILIHPANYPHELNGCLAPGLEKGVDRVKDSKLALNKLLDIININNLTEIEII